ncbi:MAG: TetR/AcrR family transcriptional regulator [Nannocystis sp.]|nr:TetR/AcrR family transcriptional regulator [Nannocystis sp.]
MARRRDEAAFEAKRAEIRQAAAALFAEHGFHQAGVAAICAAVGMSPGALYRYYRSKTEIIHAIVERDGLESIALLDALDGADEFSAALVELLADWIVEVSDEGYAKLAIEIAAESYRDPEIAAVLTRAINDVTARVALALDRARGRGQIAAEVDSEATARVLVSLVDGAMGGGSALAALPRPRLRVTLGRLVAGLVG